MSTYDELKGAFKHGMETGMDTSLTVSEAIKKTRDEASAMLNDAKNLNKAKESRKKAVAHRLSTLREEAKEKQQIVAKEIGINTVTLSGYEIGKSEPNFEVLVRLADYYQVSLDYLLCRTDTRIAFDKEEYLARDEERKKAQERIQNIEQEISSIKQELK